MSSQHQDITLEPTGLVYTTEQDGRVRRSLIRVEKGVAASGRRLPSGSGVCTGSPGSRSHGPREGDRWRYPVSPQTTIAL